MTAPEFTLREDLTLPTLAALWQELEARAELRFFLSWSWIGAWLETLDTVPPVLEGRRDGQTVLLGVVVPRHRVGGRADSRSRRDAAQHRAPRAGRDRGGI